MLLNIILSDFQQYRTLLAKVIQFFVSPEKCQNQRYKFFTLDPRYVCTCVIFNKHVPILFGWQLKCVFRATFESVKPKHLSTTELTFYLIETPFNAFANREDPDQAALARAA